MRRKNLAMAGSLMLAGCGVAVAEPRNPLDCGVALTIESYNARTHGSAQLAKDLAPVIDWYTVKGSQLPPDQRTQAQGLALVERFLADRELRKEVAKACVTQAMADPLYQAAASTAGAGPQNEAALPAP